MKKYLNDTFSRQYSRLQCSNELQVHDTNFLVVAVGWRRYNSKNETQLEFIARHNFCCFNINILIHLSFKMVRICDYYIWKVLYCLLITNSSCLVLSVGFHPFYRPRRPLE